MKNKLHLTAFVFIFIFFPFYLFSQLGIQSIDVYADVRANGKIGTHYFGFTYPKNSNLAYFHSPSIWLSAQDESGMEFLSAGMFEQGGSDFQPGPIMNAWEYSSQASKWNKTWRLTQEQIDYHIAHVHDFQYVVPIEIESWPAMGDVSLGQNLHLAPFQDVNLNGVYDPESGDYPIIKGTECIYFIFNDDKQHTETNGTALKVEIHGMLYVFTCESNDLYKRTVFADFRVFNRSTKNYNLKAGFFSAKCISSYLWGTDIQRKMAYQYSSFHSNSTYGDNPPSVAMVFLNQDSVNHFAFQNNFGVNGNPSAKYHYINYLHNLDKAQNPQKDHLGMVSNHAFSGDPINQTGWNMYFQAIDSHDVRMVSSFKNQMLAKQSSILYQMAFVFSSDNTSNFASLVKLKNEVDLLQSVYNFGSICGKSVNLENQLTDKYLNYISVSNSIVQVHFHKPISCQWQIIDLYGKCVLKGSQIQQIQTFEIQTLNLAKGMYNLIINSESSMMTEKIWID